MRKILYSGKYSNIKEPYKPLLFLGTVFFGGSGLLLLSREPSEGFKQSAIEFWIFAIIVGIIVEILLYVFLFSHHKFRIEKDNSKLFFIDDFKKIEIQGFEKWWGYYVYSNDKVNITALANTRIPINNNSSKVRGGALPTYLFVKLIGENFELVLARKVKKWEDVPSGWKFRKYDEPFSKFRRVRKLVSILGELNI